MALTKEDLQAIADLMNSRFDQVDHKLDLVEHRLDLVEHRLDQVDHRLNQVEHRLDLVEHRLDLVDHRLDLVESEISNIRLIMENEISRKIDIIGEGHDFLKQRLDDALQMEKKRESMELSLSTCA